jgi:hypothetical protein
VFQIFFSFRGFDVGGVANCLEENLRFDSRAVMPGGAAAFMRGG